MNNINTIENIVYICCDYKLLLLILNNEAFSRQAMNCLLSFFKRIKSIVMITVAFRIVNVYLVYSQG